MTETEIAYLAGLFDGEGTIGLTFHKRAENRVPYASISSTSLELLDDLRAQFGGTLRRRSSANPNWKDGYEWRVMYDRALTFVSTIRPFMREQCKIARVDLLLAEWKSVTPRNGKYSVEARAAKVAFEERFFALEGSGHTMKTRAEMAQAA